VDDQGEEHLAGQGTVSFQIAAKELESRSKLGRVQPLMIRKSQVGVVVDGLTRFCVKRLVGCGQRQQIAEVKVV